MSYDVDIAAIAERCVASDHDLDGLISALAAWDAHEDRSTKPRLDQMDEVLAEGWIHVRRRHAV